MTFKFSVFVLTLVLLSRVHANNYTSTYSNYGYYPDLDPKVAYSLFAATPEAPFDGFVTWTTIGNQTILTAKWITGFVDPDPNDYKFTLEPCGYDITKDIRKKLKIEKCGTRLITTVVKDLIVDKNGLRCPSSSRSSSHSLVRYPMCDYQHSFKDGHSDWMCKFEDDDDDDEYEYKKDDDSYWKKRQAPASNPNAQNLCLSNGIYVSCASIHPPPTPA